jgi:hypothetical protein
MKNKIRLIENKGIDIESIKAQWSPVLEKGLKHYNALNNNHKEFLCKFCHSFSLIHSYDFSHPVHSLNSKPIVDVSTILPMFIRVIGAILIETDSTNYHISDMPNFQYITSDDGGISLFTGLTIAYHDSIQIESDSINRTNIKEIKLELFEERLIEKLTDEFKKYRDIVIYPGWNLQEIQNNGTPNNTVNFTARYLTLNEIKPPVKGRTIKYVGHWEFNGPEGILVYTINKPNAFHRFMFNLLFGIKWTDGDYTVEVNE